MNVPLPHVTSPRSHSHSSASTRAPISFSFSLQDSQNLPGLGAQREGMVGPKQDLRPTSISLLEQVDILGRPLVGTEELSTQGRAG